MKHIMMADKSLLVGDEAADALVEYAALIARTNSGSSVELRAIGTDGEEVTASFLLNSGTVMVTQDTVSSLPEPDNSAVVADMRRRIKSYEFTDATTITAENAFSGED